MKRHLATVLLAVFALFPSAQATMMEELTTRTLTNQSRWIHIGEVTSKWSSWDPETKMVYTYVKLRVEKTLKGEKPEEVLIRQPGGEASGYGMVVHGMATFRRGERALVFLSQDRAGAPSVVGMAQGKFSLFKSATTGEEMALYRAPRNVEFYTKGEAGNVRHVVTTPVEKRIPVSKLISEIQLAMADTSGGASAK